jgi:hypothetical protein
LKPKFGYWAFGQVLLFIFEFQVACKYFFLVGKIDYEHKFKCRSYELFHFSCIKFIFLVIFGELLDVAMWLKLPKDMEPMKFFLAKKSWLLYFLNIKIQKITHGSTQCHI